MLFFQFPDSFHHGIHQSPESFFFDIYSVDLDPFPVFIQCGGDKSADPVTCFLKDCCQIRTNTAFPIGSGDMDKLQSFLWIPQFFQQAGYCFQSHFTAEPMTFIYICSCFYIIHKIRNLLLRVNCCYYSTNDTI